MSNNDNGAATLGLLIKIVAALEVFTKALIIVKIRQRYIAQMALDNYYNSGYVDPAIVEELKKIANGN